MLSSSRQESGTDWDVGRLMVAPDLQGQGLGRMLLHRIERQETPSSGRRATRSPAQSDIACAGTQAMCLSAGDVTTEGWGPQRVKLTRACGDPAAPGTPHRR
ncbi:GNAT family N-acetyltransferase [Micropruina sp.]|uniref:GNAT family N-acetyltransferase n=1 Tax=Micropruina sp. TaxID=2737536 RepID=UPI0039E3213A